MTSSREVARLLADITVDCGNLAEQVTSFYEVFVAEVPLPAAAALLDTTVDVVGFDIDHYGEAIVARCRRGDVVQDLHLSDLVFAPETEAAWIHAAYLRGLGMKPSAAEVPPGWRPSWL